MGDIATIHPGELGADFVSLTDQRKQWLLDNDIRFVIRYVVPKEWTKIGKNYKAWETAWYHEHGIAVLPNFERFHDDAVRYDDDRAAGENHAHRFVELCGQFGFPKQIPHFVSVDQDIWSRNVDQAKRYVEGFAAVLSGAGRELGLYGDDQMADAVRDLDPVYWRANARAWHRGSDVTVTTHIQQELPNNLLIDPNLAVRSFSAWLPSPDPIPPPEVLDMTTARLWRQKGTKEVWLLGAGTPYNVPREILDSYRSQGMRVIESDYRPLYNDCLRIIGRKT